MSHVHRRPATSPSDAGRRFLVLQLERLGDAIQTTPLLRDLRAAHPAAEIHLWVTDGAHAAVEGLPGVTVRSLPASTVIALNTEVARALTERRTPLRAREAVEAMALGAYDTVINLTHAPFAAWCASQVRARVRHGGYLNDRGETLYAGRALQYLVASVGFRSQAWMNLVDVYRCTGPGGVPPRDARAHVARAGLRDAAPPGRLVLLNPGASKADRQWPAPWFARLAGALSDAGFVPILVGAPEDVPVCAAVGAASPVPIADRSGRTSVPELAELAARAELVVTNDTGAAHVAAAAGTRVLGLYGASAWFRETAPWGTGHLVLQGAPDAPMASIPLEVVRVAALGLLGVLPATALAEIVAGTAVQAWETVLLGEGSDPLGGVGYVPRHRATVDPADVASLVLRHALAADLLGRPCTPCLDHVGAIAPGTAHGDAREALAAMAPVLSTLESMVREAVGAQKWLARKDSRRVAASAAALEKGLAELRPYHAPPVGAVIETLDWALRMMPLLAPQLTFRYAEVEYRRAAALLAQVGLRLADAWPPLAEVG